jgi:4-hydroxybenzoate polyprenyltransferase
MILNDYCDREIDSKDRPSRPLPSGRIRPNRAFNAYVFLSIAGIALACGTGACSAIIAIALVVMIYLYNKALKKTPVAPIAMGSCRFLNILLGASYVANDSAELISFPPVSIWVAASIGTFICGLTWFARNEASKSRQSNLILSTLLITVGILVLASTGYVFSLANPIGIAVLIIAVSIPAMYRVSAATAAPTALKVQQAVRALIQSLILFDAAVCILAVPGNPAFAMATLALLIPAMYLARFISST